MKMGNVKELQSGHPLTVKTLPVKIKDSIIQNMDERKVNCLVLLDSSVVLDTKRYVVLLSIL